MQAHHKAWLAAHPERSEEWLAGRLADGFDVHHGDGDHSNNEPDNLFLVEHRDHVRLHGSALLDRMRQNHSARVARAKACRLRIGCEAYTLKAQGYHWVEIARHFSEREEFVSSAAREYAKAEGERWPFPRQNTPRHIRRQPRQIGAE